MKRFGILMMIAVLFTAVAHAVPAQPGWRTFTQSDGKTVTYQVVGDEWSHAVLTRDGLMLTRGDDGDLYYFSSLTGRTAMRAHDEKFRNAVETAFIEAQRSQFNFHYQRKDDTMRTPGLFAPNRVGGSNADAGCPSLGDRAIPVILVEYQDIKFSHTKDEITTSMITGNKGVEQYFKDQSNNLYRPKFDVYGIYTLSQNRSYYGENGDQGGGDDIRIGDMVTEAVQLAAANGVSFKPYDTNSDDTCDVVIIIYAGVGEAQATVKHPESIWPKHWDLINANENERGGNGAFRPNNGGPAVNGFAVFNEMHGDNDKGNAIDGIGTFCHEFSHCLGLPDFYSTAKGSGKNDESGRKYNEENYGMGSWSLMDYGCYNENTYTPIGYNAFEKHFMGWLDYKEAIPGTYYTLKQLNQGNDEAVCIRSDLATADNWQEYFVLENRSNANKWDKFIRDKEGILITHVCIFDLAWRGRTVNYFSDYQLCTIIPSDNELDKKSDVKNGKGTEDRDLWPTKKQAAFTDDTSPAAELILSSNYGVLYKPSERPYLGKPVTDMVINSDGTASFWFMKEYGSRLGASTSKIKYGKVKYGTKKTATITIQGKNLTQDITLVITGKSADKFTVEKTTIPVAPVCTADGYSFSITYTALKTNATLVTHVTHEATLTVRSGDQFATPIELVGQSSVYGDEDGDGQFNIDDLTASIDYMLAGSESATGDLLDIDALTGMIDNLLNGETTIDLTDGLVAYYPFNGNARDMSGNGNHGVATNVTATAGVTGEAGTAYRFGGTSNPGYIRVPASASLQFTDGFTFSCFIKPTDWGGMDGYGNVVDNGSHCIFAKSSDRTGPAMMFSGNDDGLHVWCGTVNDQCQWANIGSSDLLNNGDYLNRWVHVAVSYSASQRQSRLYVNGNLINQKSITTPIDFSLMNASDLYLGRFLTTRWWNPMDGVLDEVRIYNRALTTPEVKELATEFITDAGVSLSQTAVTLAVGEEVRIDINNGCGRYSVGSTPDVVDCRLEGETIVLTGMGEGTTNVTFIDLDSRVHILVPVTVGRTAMTYTVNGVSFTMMPVEGGTFTMGATAEQGSDAADNEKPAHQVTLSSYSIGQTEVTQELWQAVMGSNPSMYTGDPQRPVERVSWDDCQTFIAKLNQLTGLTFRLPTEAEWEFAARGGNKSQGYKYAGGNTLSEVAWWGFGYDDSSATGNSGFTTHPVATKLPNELDLYDMSGNVLEWCQDWLGLYSSNALVNPTGIESGTSRVSRGGGWGNVAANCRVSYRIGNLPTNRHPALGLRLAL